ncbi:hypothetical protein ACLB2K_011438 [Fragaria x ananassa]
MESPLGFLPTLFFAFLLFLVCSPSSTIATTRFVETVCNQTTNNSECLKVLESDPRIVAASNYKELAPIALDLAITYAINSEAFVKGLNNTNPSEAVKQCADAYKYVVLDFQSAKKDLNDDPMSANYAVTLAATDDIDSCEAALKRGGVQVPPISSINHLLHSDPYLNKVLRVDGLKAITLRGQNFLFFLCDYISLVKNNKK